MIQKIEKCDVCSRSNLRTARVFGDKVLCSLTCWKEFWAREWQRWKDCQVKEQKTAEIAYKQYYKQEAV